MLPYEISLYFFIFLESIQLILVLSSLFSKSNIIVWSGYILAGFKFSIASVLSIDMITYNIFYNQLGNIDADMSSGMEIGFVYLLYLAKSINLPMGIIHFSLVVFFLFTVNNFFTYLLPKREANTMTLVFGLFPVGGELCIYLLRQLASTSIVILGVTFSLRGKKIIGFIVYLLSLAFHISSIIYMPFVIIGFIKKKSLKVIVLVALYALIVSFFFLPPDIFLSATSGVDGGSDYTSKYEKYTTSFDDRSDTTIGLFTISTVAYLAWGLIKMYKQLKDTNMFYYGCSSLIMFLTYIVTEFTGAFWMSSRIKFISTMLIMSSNIILTTNYVVKAKAKVSSLCLISLLLFAFSIFFVNGGHANHDLYKIPIYF